jgi:hypothetical protein
MVVQEHLVFQASAFVINLSSPINLPYKACVQCDCPDRPVHLGVDEHQLVRNASLTFGIQPVGGVDTLRLAWLSQRGHRTTVGPVTCPQSPLSHATPLEVPGGGTLSPR